MLKIEKWADNLILRAIAKEVWEKDLKEVVNLGKEMIKYIKNKDNWWIWLAAPQIWKSIRLIVVWLPKKRNDENYKVIMMINPKILSHNDKTEIEEEWCLSLVWIRGKVPRFTEIKVSFLDENKKPKTLILEWLQARIVQHEVDHLNGILFIDYLKK
jgi:peptide deformylase